MKKQPVESVVYVIDDDASVRDAVRLAIERDRARRKDEKNITVLKSQFASLTAREKEFREIHPGAVALPCKLRRRRLKGGQLSLREVSKELPAHGFLNERC